MQQEAGERLVKQYAELAITRAYTTCGGIVSLHMPIGPYYTGTKTRFRVFMALTDGTVASGSGVGGGWNLH